MTSGQAKATARERRSTALRDVRRSLLVDAAKTVFKAVGLEGASMRSIAAEAGCSTGAIYPYFQGKEELYAAVLTSTLEALKAEITNAVAISPPNDAAQTGLQAFFDYYLSNPDDLALGLYLFGGVHPTGLSNDLNRALNEHLREIFALVEDAFSRAGAADPAGQTASGMAQATGLLILEQTGRLRLFKRDASDLFSSHLSAL